MRLKCLVFKGSTTKEFMKYKNILILEAGGPCAVSCIKLLKQSTQVRTIAADMDPYAAGLYLADEKEVIPSVDSEFFSTSISNVLSKHNINAIFPTFENGLVPLSEVKANFLIDFKSALLCKDQLVFCNLCKEKNLPIPKTITLQDWKSIEKYPQFIKPRFGVGSRDNFIIHNSEMMLKFYELYGDKEDFITQDFLEGDHWNVDVLVEDGEFVCAVPRRDIRQKSGNPVIVEVVDYKELSRFSCLVQQALSIKSVFNLEVFEVDNGKFVINEINVRFGGGIIFSALAGCDMVSYLATGNRKFISDPKNMIISRYFEEVQCK